ncbi:hypothetical protein FBUS_01592 [Fasciolopsis buskii]|uniref:Uncharacterized protein n=1 Tax=Fasciolopsis buskii TaxID=27845 RepID=A0A8E0RM96_9TREM|nr:hypothetical protein FBUS_01592 [Fasciolopsis buski]
MLIDLRIFLSLIKHTIVYNLVRFCEHILSEFHETDQISLIFPLCNFSTLNPVTGHELESFLYATPDGTWARLDLHRGVSVRTFAEASHMARPIPLNLNDLPVCVNLCGVFSRNGTHIE